MRKAPVHVLCAVQTLMVVASIGMTGCEPSKPTPTSGPIRYYEASQLLGVLDRNVSGDSEQTYIVETMSAGVAFIDVDDDADQDLFLVSGTRFDAETPTTHHHRLYRNDPAPEGQPLTRRYVDISRSAGVTQPGWGMGVAAADTDNDGDTDLLVTHWGADRLYLNDGTGRFADMGAEAGVADQGWASSAAFGDLDGDGSLDLYVTRYLEFDRNSPPGGEGRNCYYKGLEVFCGPRFVPPLSDLLYRNRADGSFENLSGRTGIATRQLPGMGVVFADIDDDGDLDIYVANDSEPNLLYRNDDNWRFTEVADLFGVAFTEDGRPQAGMGIGVADIDEDLDLDLFVTNFSDDTNTLYLNEGVSRFREVTHAAGVGGVARPLLGWSAGFLDADRDGWLDLFVANGHLYPQLRSENLSLRYEQPNLLYRNQGGTFHRIAHEQIPDLTAARVSRAAAIGDIDNDGDPDLVVVNLNDSPSILLNATSSDADWLGLDLRGGSRHPSPIGTRVDLHLPGRTLRRDVTPNSGFQSSHDPRLLFGLGAAAHIDSVVIAWPSGTRQALHPPIPLRRYLIVHEAEPFAAQAPAPSSPTSFFMAPSAHVAPATQAPLQDQTAESASPDSAFVQGKRLYEEGRYEEALSRFSVALERDPEDLSARVNAAVTLFMGLGRRDEAAEQMQQAVEHHPNRHEPRLWLGKLALHGGRLDMAIEALRQSIARAPMDAESYHWLGLGLLRADSVQTARTMLERAVRLTPHLPRPHLALARALDRLGERQEAEQRRQLYVRLSRLQARVEEYEQRLATETRDARLCANLGTAYAQQRRFDSAARLFAESIEADPGYARGHYGLGLVMMELSRVQDAMNAFKAAVAAEPGMIEARNAVGQIYHQTGDYKLAIAAFEEALTIDPRAIPVQSNLAISYTAMGDTVRARSAWQRVLTLAPGNRLAEHRLEQLQ